ncbi:MAG: hypothetical protein ACM3SW_07035 [Actinomycetota bacterium]
MSAGIADNGLAYTPDGVRDAQLTEKKIAWLQEQFVWHAREVVYYEKAAARDHVKISVPRR